MEPRSAESGRARRVAISVVVAALVVIAFGAFGGLGLAKSPLTAAQYQYGKVTICHKAGPHGKRVTITVSRNALPAHLAHGDTVGPCPPGSGKAAAKKAKAATKATAKSAAKAETKAKAKSGAEAVPKAKAKAESSAKAETKAKPETEAKEKSAGAEQRPAPPAGQPAAPAQEKGEQGKGHEDKGDNGAGREDKGGGDKGHGKGKGK